MKIGSLLYNGKTAYGCGYWLVMVMKSKKDKINRFLFINPLLMVYTSNNIYLLLKRFIHVENRFD